MELVREPFSRVKYHQRKQPIILAGSFELLHESRDRLDFMVIPLQHPVILIKAQGQLGK